MLSKSDWRLSQSVGSLIVANTLVSSAKLVMLLLTLDEMSLIRTRKSTGPNTVPCGTPLRTLSPLLTPPGILTCWRLFVKKLCSHSPSSFNTYLVLFSSVTSNRQLGHHDVSTVVSVHYKLLEPVGVPTGLCWGFYFGLLLLEYLTCISWCVCCQNDY